MFKGIFGKAETGKLIISAVALCVDPTGIAAAGLGADAAIHIREKILDKNPELQTLAKEIDAEFKKKLATPAYDKPDDARQLLPQMLSAALNDTQSFVKHGLDADEILADLAKNFKKPDTEVEFQRPEMITAFTAIYGPLLHIACNDPRLKAALDPALYREDRKETRAAHQDIRDMKGMMADFMSGANIPLDDMKLLAGRFEEHNIEDMNGLKAFLTQKATEYRAYRDTIDLIDDRIASLGNLKAAATDAAEKLDFEEVENLLSRVAQVEAEVFATTQEARAQNALLRNRPDQAFQIYTTAAEAFRELDLHQMAHRRNTYREALYGHGLRYGATGLLRAIDIIRPAIAALKDTDAQINWAAYTQNLAVALEIQGGRTEGPAGTALLAQAVTAYRDALTVFTKTEHPLDWATTTQNLAIALRNQGGRTEGPAGTALLAQAVTAYRDALTITTKTEHPLDWATTTQNLAVALEIQGGRTEGPAGTALLAQAVTAYRDALTITTKTEHPLDWATTTQNLAVALEIQGGRTEGPAGTALLAQAVTAYRDALTVFTKTEHPLGWATTTQNLAGALRNQGGRTEGPAGTALLAQAVTAYRDALTVFTKTDHPQQWAETQENLAIAERETARHTATTDPLPHLHAALDHVDAALTVYHPDHTSYHHATATRLRDAIRADIAAHTS